MNNYVAIPGEMQSYRQWIAWRYEETQNGKPTKVPYDPKNGYLAAVDNPDTWNDFNIAVAVANAKTGFDGIGFVLTEHDPYCFIDLDGSSDANVIARQNKIFESFDSYSERSPSGTGCHIIIKGHVPRGRKRASVEIYSSLRYMTMTGDVVANKPINQRHDLANLLWGEMGKDNVGNTVVMEGPQTEEDNMILVKGMNMPNSGDKFKDLLTGNWQIHYPEIAAAGQGPSEADFALIDMIQFHTKNVEQITRIFLNSALGQRAKAKRKDYVGAMVSRAFDRDLAPQDFDFFKITAMNLIAAQKGEWSTETETPARGAEYPAGEPVISAPESAPLHSAPLTQSTTNVNPYTFPPGLIGAIAEYIYRSAPRPVPEIALAGAIGLMSGICGRTFQTPTGVALNLYTLLIAKSGRGKEAMAQGIWRIMHTAARMIPSRPGEAVPAITQFIGPADFRSDAALTKELSTRPCFISIMGEFGLRMQAMVAPNASSHLLGLKSVMLDLYHKADRSSQLSEMVYSDKDKNTKAVYRPSFSILAETTPSTYYEALSESLIMQGLLSRFFTIEYPGDRTELNSNNVEPSLELTQGMGALAVQCLTMMNQNKIVNITFDNEADAAQSNYNRRVDKYINTAETDAFAELWNRAHLKALKLASLVAVGINPHHPVVNIAAWNWAATLIDRDVTNTIEKFASGEVGRLSGNDDQNRALTDIFVDWYTKSWDQVKSACAVDEGELYHQSHVVPHSYISLRASKLAAFRNDKQGINRALYSTIRNFTTQGLIIESKANVLKDAATGQLKFKGHGVVYTIKDEMQFRQRAQGKRH